ncbi:MAG TPA: DNA polymerase III subunit delta', partial [Smithellaceae bacterium]|nr:DNA polymerase III subunit delta' [Smithellaceae bacterium]
MSYSDIYGHEKQIEILKRAQIQERVGHAYLFNGAPGIGKRTLALEFARALNCTAFDEQNDACGRCLSCRKIEHHNHPDIAQIAADGQFIRINAVREIQEQMRFRPLEATRRVFIIDDADRMNEQAANALLKTLEEPTVHNLLILITARPHTLPRTILSRCRQMRFQPLTTADVVRYLRDKLNMEEKQAVLLAGISGGSPGLALEQNKDETIAGRQEILNMLGATRSKNPLSLLSFASFFGRDKKEIKLSLSIIKTVFRDAMVFKETGRQAMLINQDNMPLIESLSSRLSG